MNANNKYHRSILQSITRRAMLERGLLPDYSTEALAELARLQTRAGPSAGPADGPHGIHEMLNLLGASIDNNDSRDLDQLTVAEAMDTDKVKIRVAIADVDSFIENGSAGKFPISWRLRSAEPLLERTLPIEGQTYRSSP